MIVERKCDMVCEHIVFHSRKFSAARQQLAHSAAAASASQRLTGNCCFYLNCVRNQLELLMNSIVIFCASFGLKVAK
jgi:hypothetical protein